MVGIPTPHGATVHNGQSLSGQGPTPSSCELAAELCPVGPHWPRTHPARCSVSTTTGTSGQSRRLSPARCAGECGLGQVCVRRLLLALVQLMAQSRHAPPALLTIAVQCSRMWLWAQPANVAGDAR